MLVRFETRALFLWIGVAALAWGFLAVAGEVMEGDTRTLDNRLLLLLRVPGHSETPVGPLWLPESMRDLTAVGGFTLLALLTITAIIWLLLHNKRRHAAVLGTTVVLAQVSSEVLKAFYDRPRPAAIFHADAVYSQSFPSGHSTMAAATFFTLAAIVSTLENTVRAKIFVFVMASVMTVGVGFSRVYLGVHWPSDVLGGWALGALWAVAARTMLQFSSPSCSIGAEAKNTSSAPAGSQDPIR